MEKSSEQQGFRKPLWDKSPSEVPSVPSREAVHEWIKRDISAASYFLSMLLRYPDIMESMSGELYAAILKKEQGPAIDHVKTEENAD